MRKTNAERQRAYRERHPERVKEQQRKWRENNKEYNSSRQRKYQIKANYGMSLDDYDAMLVGQKGQCAICGTTNPHNRWKVFAVDHCHETGKVRGLLCNKCNRGMGLLDDDADRLIKAAEYLNKHKVVTAEEKARKKENKID